MVASARAIGVTAEDAQNACQIERGLLACCLRSEEAGSDAFDEVSAIVTADDFAVYVHQLVFKAMLEIRSTRVPVMLDTLYVHLQKRGQLAELGGAPSTWLAELLESQPTGALAAFFAGEVRSGARRRALKRAVVEMTGVISQPGASVDEMAAKCEQLIFSASAVTPTTGGPRSVADLIAEELQAIDDRASGNGPRTVLTGYSELDAVMGGMEREQLVVVGARPSVGKSAFALGVAANVAANGTPVLFCCLEMSAREMAQRLLAILSGVPLTFIREARLTPDQARRLNDAKLQSTRLPLKILDLPNLTADRLAAVVRRAKRRDDVGLVVIDYLQLMTPDNARESRNEQISILSRRMKLVARECQVPVILLSQLNRGVEGRNDKPRLSDLRDSGSIEQDADCVLLLSRQEDPKPEDKTLLIDVDVKKARNGATGAVSLKYIRSLTRFENAAY